ncbi:MAG: Crp/Fnr family transcriptional regulator [Fimbriimonadaceae bacterium]|nr:Crp/Fnr family transcriptional regulator [Chitinophagales bacterium]
MPDVFKKYLSEKGGITDLQFDKIEPFLFERKIKKGETILEQGEVCKNAWFVEVGCLRSYVTDKKGKEYIFQFAPENWWISEQNSLHKNEPSLLSIDALENSSVVVIGANFFEQLPVPAGANNNFRHVILQNRLYSLQKRIIYLLSATAEERYIDFLNTYPALSQRLSQKLIASYLGITPESLSRVRKELFKKN